MKNKRSILKLWVINVLGSFAMLMVILLTTGNCAKAQKNQPLIKIGVYDSRAVEISKNAPIRLDELTIEQDMLDSYCKRFGKK